jgi:hypothetical protein
MILSIAVLIAIGIVAFFHYVQGLFSATLSAVFAVVAAVLAVGYHEHLVGLLLQGRFADQAHAIALVALFAAIYLILRVIFDSMIPGNVQFPPLVDKIGAGAMGVIAGLFAVGLVVIAAQTLPFGPSIGGYTRFEVHPEQPVIVPSAMPGRRAQDAVVYNELRGDALDPRWDAPGLERARREPLMIPADDVVIGMVEQLSDGGSLAGAMAFKRIHPDYLQQSFGVRVGIQVGAQKTALNLGPHEHVTVTSVHVLESVPALDGEVEAVRRTPLSWLPPANQPLRPGPEEMLLVVRTMIDTNAADGDRIFRFSPASIRLAANGTNYHPIGTLQNARTLFGNKPDDFLLMEVPAETGVDLVFMVRQADVVGAVAADAPQAELTLRPGVLLEVKRLARIDLGGQTVERRIAPDERVSVLRKAQLPQDRRPAQPPTPGMDPGMDPGMGQPPMDQPAAELPLDFEEAGAYDAFPTAIGLGSPTSDGPVQLVSGSAVLRQGTFASLQLDPDEAVQRLSRGASQVEQMHVPEGMQMIQVSFRPRSPEWNWLDNISAFQLLDANGQPYPPHGIWASVQTETFMGVFARYDAQQPLQSVGQPAGAPQQVWLAFLVPSGTQLRGLAYQGQPAVPLNLTAP